MSQLMHAFNPMDHDPKQGGAGWPLGKHPVIITGSEIKATSDNQNGRLVFKLQVIDGPNKGHTGEYGLNLYHQSADASRIAHNQLSALCHVLQTFQLGQNGQDLTVLYNKPFVVEVDYQKGHAPGSSDTAKGYTEIRKVYDMAGNEPGKNGSAQQSSQPQNGGFNNQQNNAPQQQQQNNGGAGAWGQNQNGQQAQQNDPQAQQGNGGSWGNAQQQNAQQNANAGGNGGGWQQNSGGGNNGGGSSGPSWGQR
jgi:hypothetical protein